MPAASFLPRTRLHLGRQIFAALIENPNYRRYFLGHGISLVGTWLQQAAVLWIVYDMTGSEWWTGAMEATSLVPGLFVGLMAGVLADRIPPRKLVIVMLVGQMILAFSLAALVHSQRVQLWQMAAILALTRVCVTFELPSRQVFLYHIVGQERLMNAIALNSGLFNASRVIGPAMAGFLLANAGATACFVLNALSFLAAIAAIGSIRPVGLVSAGSRASRSILGGFTYLRSDPLVRNLFLLMIAFGVVGMGYSALLPAYARKVVLSDERGYSMLLACVGLGATVGALYVAGVGSLRRRNGFVLGGIALFGVSIGMAGWIPPALIGTPYQGLALPVACLAVLFAGCGGILFYSSTQTLIQLAVPDHLRGRILGIWMIAFSGSVPLGALWAGWAANTFGVCPVLQVAAVVCVCLATFAGWTGALNVRPVTPTHENPQPSALSPAQGPTADSASSSRL